MATSDFAKFLNAPPPQAASSELRAYLDFEFNEVALRINALLNTVQELRQFRIFDGLGTQFQWDDSGTTPADPGAGFVRADANNLNSATTLWVSKTDAFGRSIPFNINRADGQPILMQSYMGGAYILGTVGTAIDNGAYVTLPFALSVGSGNPGQGDLAEVRLYPTVDDFSI